MKIFIMQSNNDMHHRYPQRKTLFSLPLTMVTGYQATETGLINNIFEQIVRAESAFLGYS